MGKKIEYIKEATIKTVCAQALGVDRRNIYHLSRIEQKDLQLKQDIEQAHIKHPSYGHKRLALHLKVNHKRVLRVMRKYGIKPPRRKIHHFCTQSTSHRTYTNLIDTMYFTHANQAWCSDTTEFKYHGAKWYLVTVIDIFTRELKGIAIGRHHNSRLVLQAIEIAISVTNKTPDIFHSDQGSEFMAEECISMLEGLGVKISVSDKASPWQNGYQESFFGRFKEEFGDINRFETEGELIEAIYHYVYYYNTQRIHTALKMPPTVYANSLRILSDKWGT